MIKTSDIDQISEVLREIGNPARLRILLEIGENEVCVCHLEAALGMRQAYLSQHLMVLRQIGVLKTSRQGKYINYQLADQKLLEVIKLLSDIFKAHIEWEKKFEKKHGRCTCPRCQNLNLSASLVDLSMHLKETNSN